MPMLRNSEVRSSYFTTLVVGLALTVGLTACSRNSSPDGDLRGSIFGSDSTAVVSAGDSNENASTAARFGVPPGHLPPAGQCRVWMPGEPPGQQEKEYPVGQCSTLSRTIPSGGWLIYRPTDSNREIRVWEYGSDHNVLAERVYDSITGELLRHVTPPE